MVAADDGEGPPRPAVAVPAAELDTGSDAPVEAVPAAPAVLAEGVRSRVLELAAEALADMAAEDVPGLCAGSGRSRPPGAPDSPLVLSAPRWPAIRRFAGV